MSKRIAILGDLHYCISSTFSEAVARDSYQFYYGILKSFFSIEADLHVALGDVTHNGTREEWQAFITLATSLTEPYKRNFSFVIGNHDTLNCSKKEIIDLTRQPLYSMTQSEDLLILMLDTTIESSPLNWGGCIESEQLKWIKSIDSHAAKVILALGHHPFPNTTRGSHQPMMSLSDPQQLYLEVSKSNCPVIYVNGHNHVHSSFEDKGLWPNWTFIQAPSVLSNPSTILLEVSPTGQWRTSTIVIDDPLIHANAQCLRANMDNHYYHPTMTAFY